MWLEIQKMLHSLTEYICTVCKRKLSKAMKIVRKKASGHVNWDIPSYPAAPWSSPPSRKRKTFEDFATEFGRVSRTHGLIDIDMTKDNELNDDKPDKAIEWHRCFELKWTVTSVGSAEVCWSQGSFLCCLLFLTMLTGLTLKHFLHYFTFYHDTVYAKATLTWSAYYRTQKKLVQRNCLVLTTSLALAMSVISRSVA